MSETTLTDAADDIETSNLEIAAQLVELSKLGSLDTLKECILDVKNGQYQTSKEAQLATNTLQVDGMQQGEVLFRKETILAPGETITANDGEILVAAEE